MRSSGRALIWQDCALVRYKRSPSPFSFSTVWVCVKRQLSASQKEHSHWDPNWLPSWSWTSQPLELGENKFLLLKLPNLQYFIMTAYMCSGTIAWYVKMFHYKLYLSTEIMVNLDWPPFLSFPFFFPSFLPSFLPFSLSTVVLGYTPKASWRQCKYSTTELKPQSFHFSLYTSNLQQTCHFHKGEKNTQINQGYFTRVKECWKMESFSSS